MVSKLDYGRVDRWRCYQTAMRQDEVVIKMRQTVVESMFRTRIFARESVSRYFVVDSSGLAIALKTQSLLSCVAFDRFIPACVRDKWRLCDDTYIFVR